MEGLIPLVYKALRRHTSRRNYHNLQAGEGISESHGLMNYSSVNNHEADRMGRFRKGKSLCLRVQDFGEEQFVGRRAVNKEELQQNNEMVKRKRERLRPKSFAL